MILLAAASPAFAQQSVTVVSDPFVLDTRLGVVGEKVIIVAGGGNYPGNGIAEQTRNLAEFAYETCARLDIDPEDIQYLSAFERPSENQRVDAPATRANLEAAILDWGADARRLTIFLLDHGSFDAASSTWTFYIDFSSRPTQTITAREFDTLLDTAQNQGVEDVVLAVDMCYAGGFVRQASGSPPGTRRVVLTSTTDDRLAVFGGGREGQHSFTYHFLIALSRGATLWDAYRIAADPIKSLNRPPRRPQDPWLDDDGDARASLLDGDLARLMWVGTPPRTAFQAPVIERVPEDTAIQAGVGLPVSIELAPGQVDAAEVLLTWEGEEFPDGLPISSVETVALAREGTSLRWGGTIPAAMLEREGEYQLVYMAYANDPALDGRRHASAPAVQTVARLTLEPGGVGEVRSALLGLIGASEDADRNDDGTVDAGDLVEP